jgi:hypothetical protein
MTLARAVADELASDGAIHPVDVVEVASGEDGVAVGWRLAAAGIDVVLVLQTMAVPAADHGRAWTSGRRAGRRLGAPRDRPRRRRFDHRSITTQGATVGRR